VSDQRGFTLIELLIVVAVLGILFSVLMAGHHYARMRGAEASAMTTLQAINQAQFAFMQTCGNQRYAPTLASLGRPVPATGSPYLSPDLTQGMVVDDQGEHLSKSGYAFRMAGTEIPDAPPTCIGVPPIEAYQVTADPLRPGITGMRYFGTNADRVVYEDSATFAGNMPETGAPTHGSEIR
jgi:type IV pilus assembly protein PilA